MICSPGASGWIGSGSGVRGLGASSVCGWLQLPGDLSGASGSWDDLWLSRFRMDWIRVGGPFLKITDALFFDLSDFIFSFRLSLARDGSRQGDPGFLLLLA